MSFFFTESIVYLVYGKISATRTNKILEISATFLSLVSRVFLLPYSFPPDIPPIPNPKPPFGDISNTDPINAIHATISTIIKRVRIFLHNKK